MQAQQREPITLQALEMAYPHLNWRRPVRVVIANYGAGWGCRVCIALKGMLACEGVPFTTYDEAEEHIHLTHGTEPG